MMNLLSDQLFVQQFVSLSNIRENAIRRRRLKTKLLSIQAWFLTNTLKHTIKSRNIFENTFCGIKT